MKKAALLLAAAMGLASTPALASQFDYSAFTVTDGQNITLSGLVSETVDAGQIVLTGSGPNAGQMLDVWCVDVFTRPAELGAFQHRAADDRGLGRA